MGQPDVKTHVLDIHATHGNVKMDYVRAALTEVIRVPVNFKEDLKDEVLLDGMPVPRASEGRGGAVAPTLHAMPAALGGTT